MKAKIIKKSVLVLLMLISIVIQPICCKAELRVSLFGSINLKVEGSNTANFYTWMDPCAGALGYPTINGRPSVNYWTVNKVYHPSAYSIKTALRKNHIVIIRGHGKVLGSKSDDMPIIVDLDESGRQRLFQQSDIIDEDLSNCDLCILASCFSANGVDSMAATIDRAGAKCTIGFVSGILHDTAETWVNIMCQSIGRHYTIKQAMKLADTEALKMAAPNSEKESITEREVFGNEKIFFSQSVNHK